MRSACSRGCGARDDGLCVWITIRETVIMYDERVCGATRHSCCGGVVGVERDTTWAGWREVEIEGLGVNV